MSTRRMTRETREECLWNGQWLPMSSKAGFDLAWCLERNLSTRTVERYVTEWVEVVE